MNWTQWLIKTRSFKLSNEDLADYIRDDESTPQNIKEQLAHKDYNKAAKWLNTIWFGSNIEKKSAPKEIVKTDLKLVIADGSSSNEYINFLNERFNVEVVKAGDDCDLVLFTGGEDVSPIYYRENMGSQTYCNESRDKKERDIYRMYRNVPKLGICRGNQFLAAMSGAKLIQHVSGHGRSHYITIEGYGTVESTSSHHQMVYPFELPEDKYKILAYSKQFRSDTYLNGNNEEIELPRDFVEVEIIKFGKDVLGIQGHPEYSNATSEFKNYCLDLIVNFVNNKDNVYKSKYSTYTHSTDDQFEPLPNVDYGVTINSSSNRVINSKPFIGNSDNIHWTNNPYPSFPTTRSGETISLRGEGSMLSRIDSLKEEYNNALNAAMNIVEEKIKEKLPNI